MSPQRLRLPIIFASTLLFIIILGFFATSSGSPAVRYILSTIRTPSPKFHILLPATASNLNFCRLLLSAAVTGCPNPTVLGWEGLGQYNGSESHLFKISEALAYLNRLPRAADDDLVLLLDAYDIWLQLPPEVLIARYHKAIEKGNARLSAEGTFGAYHGGAKVKQSILFGPDKTCWPDDNRRAACWAVPESSLSSDAFGPATDTWIVPNRPRWLNSGTIMGPAKDMREMFAATMDMVHRKFDPSFKSRNSDQYYFQGVRTEFHVTLDYESDVFQTSAYYKEYLTWMSFNRSTSVESQVGGSIKRMDQFVLDEDILRSRPPFAADYAGTSMPTGKGWEDMMLGVNAITQQVFPVLHITNEKKFRELWWPQMWFHPHARTLLEYAKRRRASTIDIIAPGRGATYVGATSQTKVEGKGNDLGVWTDRNEFLSWDNVCSNYHQELFI